MNRHKGLDWAKAHASLEAKPEKQRSLHDMECTASAPDIVGLNKKSGEYTIARTSAKG